MPPRASTQRCNQNATCADTRDSQANGNGAYASFDSMCWPVPGPSLDEIEWRMRWGIDVCSERMVAASVLAAYRALVLSPARKRARVVRQLRAAMQRVAAESGGAR